MPGTFTFTEYRKEIIEVGVHEYSYERHIQVIQDESYNEGFNNGHSGGVQDTNDLYAWLFSQGRANDVEKATNDPDFLSQLFDEHEEWKRNNSGNS